MEFPQNWAEEKFYELGNSDKKNLILVNIQSLLVTWEIVDKVYQDCTVIEENCD